MLLDWITKLIEKLYSKCFFVTGFFIGMWYSARMRRRGFGNEVINYYCNLTMQKVDEQFPDDKPINLFKWASAWVRTLKIVGIAADDNEGGT